MFIFVLICLLIVTVSFAVKNNGKVAELESDLYNKDREIGYLSERNRALSETVHNLEVENTRIKTEYDDLKQTKDEISDIEDELNSLHTKAVLETYNFSEYDGLTSEECKNKVSLLKVSEQELIKNDDAVILEYHPGKSERKLFNNNKKQILRCFNSDCDNILLSLTTRNIDTMRSKMHKSFETLNKIFEVDGVQLNPELLKIKLEELNFVYTAEQKKEQEREEQKAIKAQMVEEEKVRREIEREKAKIEKEEHQFKNEVSKLMKYLQKASDIEKQLYIDKINELEDKIKLLEKDKENILQREQNTRAGFVYIISNIGSFGENIYKIGMTRRLEPMDRVKELGDASVPFEFDVHAMIFSEDAPRLENTLHETFRKNQVNKVNNRKEFFNVSLDDIEKVVKENHNATVTFTKLAKAEQYRESLRLAENAS